MRRRRILRKKLTLAAEKFRLHLHAWFHDHNVGNMGIRSLVSHEISRETSQTEICSVNASALLNGGPVCLVYGFIFCFLGSLATAASLAEMVSM